MSQRKSPKSQVRSGVGDSSKDELDSLNHRMHENISKGVSSIFFAHRPELLVKIIQLSVSSIHHFISDFSAGVFFIVAQILFKGLVFHVVSVHHWLLEAVSSIDVGKFNFSSIIV